MFPQIRELSRNITVYGLGDVAVSIVNVFLLGVYVRCLETGDYGVIEAFLARMSCVVFARCGDARVAGPRCRRPQQGNGR